MYIAEQLSRQISVSTNARSSLAGKTCGGEGFRSDTTKLGMGAIHESSQPRPSLGDSLFCKLYFWQAYTGRWKCQAQIREELYLI